MIGRRHEGDEAFADQFRFRHPKDLTGTRIHPGDATVAVHLQRPRSDDPEGGLKVHRYVVAIDSGYVVNPNTCAAQAESNAVYGLGALFHTCSVRDGRIEQSNFHDFRLPMIGDMPKVELVLVPTGGFWGGHGEPGILPFQAAVLNAVCGLTGKRIRSLPLKKEDLRRA